MGSGYLIDTNILIYFIENKIPQNEFNNLNNIIETSFNISCMTQIELLSWNKLKEHHINKFKTFLSNSNIFHINNEIIEKTIFVRKATGINVPDAVIAATALNNNLTLVTRNIKDFKKITELTIYNPFDGE